MFHGLKIYVAVGKVRKIGAFLLLYIFHEFSVLVWLYSIFLKEKSVDWWYICNEFVEHVLKAWLAFLRGGLCKHYSFHTLVLLEQATPNWILYLKFVSDVTAFLFMLVRKIRRWKRVLQMVFMRLHFHGCKGIKMVSWE